MRRELEANRRDTMTVSRPKDGKTAYGAQSQSNAPVYVRAPCRLSFAGTDVSPDERTPDLTFTATLFYAPEHALLRGDSVTVTRCGKTYKGRAGEPAEYPSHIETPLYIRRR